MATAASLGALLSTNADYNYYVQQQLYWTAKYEANQEKLEKQVGYEQKWESAFEDAQNVDKKCQVGTHVYKEKDQAPLSDELADEYAHAKVSQYDEELSLELAELDVEYDTMKTTYDALLQSLQAQKEAEKQLVSTNAQDTHLLQS